MDIVLDLNPAAWLYIAGSAARALFLFLGFRSMDNIWAPLNPAIPALAIICMTSLSIAGSLDAGHRKFLEQHCVPTTMSATNQAVSVSWTTHCRFRSTPASNHAIILPGESISFLADPKSLNTEATEDLP